MKEKKDNKIRQERHCCGLLSASNGAENLEQVCPGHSVQRQLFNLFLNNSSKYEFLNSKGKVSHNWFAL